MALKRAVSCFGMRYGKKCSKCPPPAFTYALSRCLNWRIALSMFSCCKADQIDAVPQPVLSGLLTLEVALVLLQHRSSNMVIKWIQVWRVGWPLIILNEIWTIVL